MVVVIDDAQDNGFVRLLDPEYLHPAGFCCSALMENFSDRDQDAEIVEIAFFSIAR